MAEDRSLVQRRWPGRRNRAAADRRSLICPSHPLFGGPRQSPYLSTTESKEVARRFARNRGQVRQTTVERAKERQIRHISRSELLQLLRGKGKGHGAWNNAYEVMQARKYVEQWLEHLLSFEMLSSLTKEDLRRLVDQVFEGTRDPVA
jgi:hypothetical protein